MSKSWTDALETRDREAAMAYAASVIDQLKTIDAHAIAAHDDEALETHEMGSEGGVEAEPECLHRWTLVRLCEVCGEEERVFTDPGSVP